MEPHSLNPMCRSKPASRPKLGHEPNTNIAYYLLPVPDGDVIFVVIVPA